MQPNTLVCAYEKQIWANCDERKVVNFRVTFDSGCHVTVVQRANLFQHHAVELPCSVNLSHKYKVFHLRLKRICIAHVLKSRSLWPLWQWYWLWTTLRHWLRCKWRCFHFVLISSLPHMHNMPCCARTMAETISTEEECLYAWLWLAHVRKVPKWENRFILCETDKAVQRLCKTECVFGELVRFGEWFEHCQWFGIKENQVLWIFACGQEAFWGGPNGKVERVHLHSIVPQIMF